MIERSQFTVEMFDDGYLLYFRGHLIDGQKVPPGTPVGENKSTARRCAETNIDNILFGHAPKNLRIVVNNIERTEGCVEQCRFY